MFHRYEGISVSEVPASDGGRCVQASPYASFGLQPSLAILSKWLELQRTIQLFSRPADLSMMSVDAPHVSPLEMLQDISRFAAGPQRDLLSQMFQTMQMVQMLQNINPGNEEDLL